MSDASDSESPIASVEFHVEDLIAEVEKRPELWNRHYKHRHDKTMKWAEVCEALFENWRDFSSSEQKMAGAMISAKWKNLRDAFHKDLVLRQKLARGETTVRKKKYIYFDQLSFLASPEAIEEVNGITDCGSSQSDAEEEEKRTETRKRRLTRLRMKSPTKLKDNKENTEEIIIKPPNELQYYDEDISFSDMLVPMLRKLDDEKKHSIKMDIMKILNKARYYRAVPGPVDSDAP